MPIREWHLRILDMLDCIGDTKTVDAVVRNIEIIGEAARHVPKRINEKYPDIRWIDIRGMRNLVAHVYFGVDLNIVWHVATVDMVELEA